MNTPTRVALQSLERSLETAQKALDQLRESTVDTEPAPVSIVLTRDLSNGRIHRRARVSGIPGLLSYEADNIDSAGAFEVIPDLSTVSDDLDLCGRCFGGTDDLMASEVP